MEIGYMNKNWLAELADGAAAIAASPRQEPLNKQKDLHTDNIIKR